MPDEHAFKDETYKDLTLKSPTDPKLTGDPLIGAVLGGRYEVLSIIGQGGMGALYSGRHTEIGRKVAIKVLNPQLIGNEEAFLRFKREATLAATLTHTNICHVYDFGKLDDGSPYLVMDLLHGTTLSSLLDRENRLPSSRAINMFKQLCEAISYAHGKGIAHRDLKPSNIMIEDSGSLDVVKVLDFGIAKSLGEDASRLTGTHEVVGSPYYMSPEQCGAKPIDERSDIYSLGCVMFETLTSNPPFMAPAAMQIMFQHATEQPAKLRAVAPDAQIPPALENIVLKCLEKDPADRFQTARELQSALDSCTSAAAAVPSPPAPDRSLPSDVVPTSDLGKKQRGQRKIGLAAGAVGGLVLLSMILTSMLRWNSVSKIISHPDVALPALLSQPIESLKMIADDRCPGFVYNGDDSHFSVWKPHDLGAITVPPVQAIYVGQAHDQPRSKDDDPDWIGHVTVHVSNAAPDLVLVLNSNAPMAWNIVTDPGCKVERVLVTSVFGADNSATVKGVDPAIVQKLPHYVALNFSDGENIKENSAFKDLNKQVEEALKSLNKPYPLSICTFQYASQAGKVDLTSPKDI